MNTNEQQAIKAAKAGMKIHVAAKKYGVNAFWLGTKLGRKYIG